jgi:signal transduction histidine kinase
MNDTQLSMQLDDLAVRTAYKVGEAFLREVVVAFSQIFEVKNVYINECVGEHGCRVRTLAIYKNGKICDNAEFELAASPCERVIKEGIYFCGQGTQAAFPDAHFLMEMGIESYGGIRLTDAAGNVVGHLCYLHDSELSEATWQLPALKMIQARCGAEVERIRIERNRAAELKFIEDTKHLASLGTLAAGIAHEINNPLTTIQLSAEMAMLEPQDKSSISSTSFSSILTSVTAISQIVNGVLRAATNKQSSRTKCDLRDLIHHAIELTSPTAEEKSVSVTFHETEARWVIGNPIELTQVIVNLISNAIHASCDENKPIEISINRHASTYEIEVVNYGKVIPDEQREQIFEPFYTTRGQEGGTGLGLSVSRGIVIAHGGEITTRPSEGNTTTFSLAIPAHDG